MFGIGFIDDLIEKVGIPLVSKGVKALTGIDIESKELTAEDKQKIVDSQIEIMKIDFEKLKLDTESKLEDKRINLEEDKAFLGDKHDARTREIEVVKATGKTDKALYAIAGVIVLAFFVSIIVLMVTKLDKGSGTYELLLMLFGVLGAKFGTVVDYFFGSANKS